MLFDINHQYFSFFCTLDHPLRLNILNSHIVQKSQRAVHYKTIHYFICENATMFAFLTEICNISVRCAQRSEALRISFRPNPCGECCITSVMALQQQYSRHAHITWKTIENM